MKKKIWTLIIIFLAATTVYGTYNYIVTSHETIIVGYLPSNHDSALFVANAKDMFQKEGLKIRLVPFRSGPDLINAAKLGKIDIGYCGISQVTMAITDGTPIKIVASVNQEGSGIVVGNNTNITNITDLKGKNIAIPKVNSVQDVLLTYWLSQYNINRNEVNITESEVPYMPRSLLFKKFDGYAAWEPYVSAAGSEGDGKILLYSETDTWKNFPCCVVIATDSFAKDHPNALRKFLKIHVEATNYVNSHKDETALIVSQKLGTSVQIEEESLKHVEFNMLPPNEFMKNVFKFIDIKKSDYDLVIICHNHRKGYGSGYYIATPTMDTKSVNLAEAIHDILPDFSYYQRNTDEKAESTSINRVDNPIAATGTPVFVYEIPEWVGNSDVYSNSSKLIDACANFLNR